MTSSLYFCIVFLLSSWELISACSENGPCRELAFPSFLFFADKRLLNHTIKTVQVQDLDECELLCYQEHNCVSINFENKASGKGKYSCELNNSTHGEHDGDLVVAKSYFYRGTKNACSKSPCKNGGTCQSGFTKKRYRCLCPSGRWTGRNCTHDIDECEEKTHNCYQNATCKNRKGSYKCICKDGYSGDGYNCTDIDECTAGTHNCSTNAWCNNTAGSFECICKAECCTVFDFENGSVSGWKLTGTAFNNQPTYGDNPTARGREPSNHTGDWWIGGAEDRPSPSQSAGKSPGDGPQGSMTSPCFVIAGNLLKFLIGGGCDKQVIRAELIVEGRVALDETGNCHETMKEKSWDVSAYTGKQAQLRLIDSSSGSWGHINFDHFEVICD